MIALVSALGGDKIYDPEQIAENGWHRFYPHWADCPAPGGYLRKCVVSAVRDEQRAIAKAPRITCVGASEEDFAAAVPAGYLLMRDQQPSGPPAGQDPFDPELAAALALLSDEHRTVLVLAHELEVEPAGGRDRPDTGDKQARSKHEAEAGPRPAAPHPAGRLPRGTP